LGLNIFEALHIFVEVVVIFFHEVPNGAWAQLGWAQRAWAQRMGNAFFP